MVDGFWLNGVAEAITKDFDLNEEQSCCAIVGADRGETGAVFGHADNTGPQDGTGTSIELPSSPGRSVARPAAPLPAGSVGSGIPRTRQAVIGTDS